MPAASAAEVLAGHHADRLALQLAGLVEDVGPHRGVAVGPHRGLGADAEQPSGGLVVERVVPAGHADGDRALLDRGAAHDVPADGRGDDHHGRVILFRRLDAGGPTDIGAAGAVDEVDGQLDLPTADAAVLVDVVHEGGDGDRHVAEVGGQAGLGQRGEVGADERDVDRVVGQARDRGAAVAPVSPDATALVGGLAAAGAAEQGQCAQRDDPSVTSHRSPR